MFNIYNINLRVKQTRVKEMNFHHLLKRSKNNKKNSHTHHPTSLIYKINAKGHSSRRSVGAANRINTKLRMSCSPSQHFIMYTLHVAHFLSSSPFLSKIWKFSFRQSIEWLRVFRYGRWIIWSINQKYRWKKINFVNFVCEQTVDSKWTIYSTKRKYNWTEFPMS